MAQPLQTIKHEVHAVATELWNAKSKPCTKIELCRVQIPARVSKKQRNLLFLLEKTMLTEEELRELFEEFFERW